MKGILVTTFTANRHAGFQNRTSMAAAENATPAAAAGSAASPPAIRAPTTARQTMLSRSVILSATTTGLVVLTGIALLSFRMTHFMSSPNFPGETVMEKPATKTAMLSPTGTAAPTLRRK